MDKEKLLAGSKVITADQVQAAWSSGPLSHLQLIKMDEKFQALTMDAWNEILSESDTKTIQYQENFQDCDNFAVIFAAYVMRSLSTNSTAMVFDSGGKHAFNAILVTDNDKIEFKVVEPQQDTLADLSKPVYSNTSGFALIG